MRPEREASDRGVRRLYLSAVVLPIVLAAIAGAWLAAQIGRLAQAEAWIDNSDRVIAMASEVEKLVAQQEADLQTFLYTGDPTRLGAYRREDAEEDLAELEELVAGDPTLAAEARMLRRDYGAWRAQMGQAIAEAARGRPKVVTDPRPAIEPLIARAEKIAAREKEERLNWTRRFERQTGLATVGVVALLGLLAGTMSLAARRQIRLVEDLMRREREALGKAQEALRARDTFLATLSHELRTPLTPILGWVTMARSKPLQGEALERALALIERNAKNEAQIVDDLLDVSHIAAGDLRLAPGPVEMAAVVHGAVAAVELSAQAKGVTLETSIDSPLPTLLGDPQRLRQVVSNLLGNAVKFTPRGGHVKILLGLCDGGVRLVVRDDGAGFPADFLPYVFDYFRQADGSPKRAHGGLGLGLAIVRHLVELHGGEVEAESDGPGRGATFTVTLPAPAPLTEACSTLLPLPAPSR
jgi:signal transduction histidine kinase